MSKKCAGQDVTGEIKLVTALVEDRVIFDISASFFLSSDDGIM